MAVRLKIKWILLFYVCCGTYFKIKKYINCQLHFLHGLKTLICIKLVSSKYCVLWDLHPRQRPSWPYDGTSPDCHYESMCILLEKELVLPEDGMASQAIFFSGPLGVCWEQYRTSRDSKPSNSASSRAGLQLFPHTHFHVPMDMFFSSFTSQEVLALAPLKSQLSDSIWSVVHRMNCGPSWHHL